MEDCVNLVGADLNTASPALLKRVSGLSETVCKNIVSYREENGEFKTRAELKRCQSWDQKLLNNVQAF